MIEDNLMKLLAERGYQAVLTPRSEGRVEEQEGNLPDWNICFYDKNGEMEIIYPTSRVESQQWLLDDVVPVLNEFGLKDFLSEIDRMMLADFGMTHNDFEDYNWDDEFESEVEPADAYEEWKIHTEGGTRAVLGM